MMSYYISMCINIQHAVAHHTGYWGRLTRRKYRTRPQCAPADMCVCVNGNVCVYVCMSVRREAQIT